MLLQQLLIPLFLLTIIEAKDYRLIIDDEWQDCPTAKKSLKKYFDFSNFTIIQADDEVVKLSGSVVPLITLRQPLSITATTEYFEKGSWKPGMVSFAHVNICDELKRTDRFWSSMYAPFKKCPPTKGEIIDFGKETDYSVILKDVVPNYPLGNWKLMIQAKNLPPEPHTVCMQIKFELTEYTNS